MLNTLTLKLSAFDDAQMNDIGNEQKGRRTNFHVTVVSSLSLFTAHRKFHSHV